MRMRKFLSNHLGRTSFQPPRRKPRSLTAPERLESREVFAPLPVLMVIADQQDFYYQEYNDTRISLEEAGMEVDVAARTTLPSRPHPGTGQGSGSGIVTPDLTLASVDPVNYSAIVFVGGWGSSMYQYAFQGTYANSAYNGDAATKEIVNNLVDDFLDQEKFVSGLCHGVTVLAWARVDGVSPIDGKLVAVPWVGSPACTYNGQTYGSGQLMQNVQAIANGATTPPRSGAIGNPSTAADDVFVDGRIITAENYDSAREFGRVIAREVIAAEPEENHAPIMTAATFSIPENSPVGTAVGMVVASDLNAGQQLTYAITGGNVGGAFSIQPVTGRITSIAIDPLNFEVNPVFELIVTATDNGNPALSGSAVITVHLTDVAESLPPGVSIVDGNLVITGTSLADRIFVLPSTGSGDVDGRDFMIWQRGSSPSPVSVPAGGHIKVFCGGGNDVVGIDPRVSLRVELYGEGGDDLLIGGSGRDLLVGGEGNDRLEGNRGDDRMDGGNGNDYMKGLDGHDRLFGGNGNDTICGGAGNDLVLGGDGNDWLYGGEGMDMLIGGLGHDMLPDAADSDLTHGGTTRLDHDEAALLAILQEWTRSRSEKAWIEVLSY
ncbi:MAG: cadherin domain-containing protein [Pirellulaceae bacterium]|nr:cadherin domain-containing protein [Pirellulaceae bacterium]